MAAAPLTSLLPGPPPRSPPSLLPPDSESCLRSAPRPGGRGARAGLCRLHIAAGADPPQALTALGGAQQTAARAMPASNCSPFNFPCPWEPGSTKKFHQLKCCAPEHLPNARHPRKVRGLQKPLLRGKDIYKQAFSSPLPSLVDGLQTEVFGEGGLPEGLGEISLFEDQGTWLPVPPPFCMGCLRLSLPLSEMLGAFPVPSSSIHISLPCV